MTVKFYDGREITATMAMLNEISIIYDYAADFCREKGYDAYEETYRNKSNEIYDALDNIGYYDEL